MGLDDEIEIAVCGEMVGYVESEAFSANYADNQDIGTLSEPKLEDLFELEPEIIFLSGRQTNLYESMSEIAPTYVVNNSNEDFMGDFTTNYSNIGQIFGKEDEIASKLAEIEAKAAALASSTEGSDLKAMLIQNNEGTFSVYGPGSRYSVLFDVLGVQTVDDSQGADTNGNEVSFEYMTEQNPDIIFVLDRSATVGGTVLAAEALNNDLVAQTAAMQNEKVVHLNTINWYIQGFGLENFGNVIDDVASVYE